MANFGYTRTRLTSFKSAFEPEGRPTLSLKSLSSPSPPFSISASQRFLRSPGGMKPLTQFHRPPFWDTGSVEMKATPDRRDENTIGTNRSAVVGWCLRNASGDLDAIRREGNKSTKYPSRQIQEPQPNLSVSGAPLIYKGSSLDNEHHCHESSYPHHYAPKPYPDRYEYI